MSTAPSGTIGATYATPLLVESAIEDQIEFRITNSVRAIRQVNASYASSTSRSTKTRHVQNGSTVSTSERKS